MGMKYGQLWVFKNMVLETIFGPKWGDLKGEWRKLHNEDLHNLYSSPNSIRIIKSRRTRGTGHVAHMGHEKCIKILVGKCEGKRPLGRSRHR
jgi:hypothetical protein